MPTITGVSPQAFGDGRSVTVTGSGFGASGTVTIGGLTQTVTSWTDTAVVFTAVRGTQSMGPAVLDVVVTGEMVAFFTDTFSTGDFTHTESAVSWTGIDADVTVQAGRGNPGYSMQFQFTGGPDNTDCSAERRFYLGAVYTELTIMFDLYVPDGTESWGGAAYAHRDQPDPGQSENNKFFRLWNTDYNSDHKIGASMRPRLSSPQISSIFAEAVAQGDVGIGALTPYYDDFITEADRGTWMQIKLYCKAATENTLGTIRIYKNGGLVVDKTELVDNYRPGVPVGWDQGYLFGWSSSGFASTTYLQVDNVKFYSGDYTGPTWAFEGLSSGLTGLLINQLSGPVTWDAGGFARVTYNQAGTNGISLGYQSMPTGTKNVHVQFDVRRHSISVSKTLKIHSKGRYFAEGGYNDASNITVWGSAYSGADVSLSYGDGSSGGDTQSVYQFTGAHVGQDRSLPTVRTASSAIPELVYDGSTWHTLRIWIKFNDDNVQNGEFAAWIDGVLKLHLTEMWNCATTISDGVNAAVAADQLWQYQERGAISLGDYSQAPATYPFYEDYRNFKVGYSRPFDLPGY